MRPPLLAPLRRLLWRAISEAPCTCQNVPKLWVSTHSHHPPFPTLITSLPFSHHTLLSLPFYLLTHATPRSSFMEHEASTRRPYTEHEYTTTQQPPPPSLILPPFLPIRPVPTPPPTYAPLPSAPLLASRRSLVEHCHPTWSSTMEHGCPTTITPYLLSHNIPLLPHNHT